MFKAIISRIPANYLFILQDIRKRYLPNSFHLKEQQHAANRLKFYSGFLKKDDLVFDVGANLGNRVEVFLSLKCKVIAIEPQEACAAFLTWKFGNKIALIKSGMSDHSGVEEFFISDSHTISSFSKDFINSVSDSGRFSNTSWKKKVTSEVSTLENLIKQYGKPTFIKIDVEGYEPFVIRGLKSTINCVCFEYTVPELTDKSMECLEHLGSINSTYLFNYSAGETYDFELKEWVGLEEMKRIVCGKEFQGSSGGDIYAKIPNSLPI